MIWQPIDQRTEESQVGGIRFIISPGGLGHWILTQDPYLDGKSEVVAWCKTVAEAKEHAVLNAFWLYRPFGPN